MDSSADADLCRAIVEAIARGSLGQDDIVGVTARREDNPCAGVCRVVRISRSPAGHWYFYLRAENEDCYKELAKTFCKHYADVVLPPELVAKLRELTNVDEPSPSTVGTLDDAPSAQESTTRQAVNPRLQQARRRVVEERGISRLLHFTRVENLASILSWGLLPQRDAWNLAVRPLFNDYVRRDRAKYATCVSISFPNYRMFYKLRGKNLSEMSQWIVVVVSPEAMITLGCSFFERNAASKEYWHEHTEYRYGVEHLEAMFAEEVDGRSREHLELEPNLTTDPEAEVLVWGAIPRSFIMEVLVHDEWAFGELSKLNLRCKIAVCPDVFGPRHDYWAWQHSKLDS